MVTEWTSVRPRRSDAQGPDAPVGVREGGQAGDVHDAPVTRFVQTADDGGHGSRVVGAHL